MGDPLVPGIETTTLTVCHDLVASRTLYSHHTLFDEINARDHGNDSPPFNPDNFFDYDVQHFYTMDQQRITIAALVGSQELADQYVQYFNSGLFLARGSPSTARIGCTSRRVCATSPLPDLLIFLFTLE